MKTKISINRDLFYSKKSIHANSNNMLVYLVMILTIYLTTQTFVGYAQAQCDCLGYYELYNPSARIAHEHRDTDSNCIGYAFSHITKGVNPSEKPKIFMTNYVAQKYWNEWGFCESFTDSSQVEIADLALWLDIAGQIQHAAVITDLRDDYKTPPTPILCKYMEEDQGPYTGKNLTWSDMGHANLYLRKINNPYPLLCKITIKSTFENCNITVDGEPYTTGTSGIYFGWPPNDQHSLDVTKRQFAQNYWQVYRYWSAGFEGEPIISDPETELNITVSENKTYVVRFKPEYNITFKNSYYNIGNVGKMKISETTYTLPVSSFPVLDGDNITAEALLNTYNGISYSFDHWTGSVSTNPRTFNPSDHTTYTAYYTGTPTQVEIVSSNGTQGDPITIVWRKHSTSNVSYEVWRTVKNVEPDPVKVATKNHNDTCYVDAQYTFTTGYTEDLLKYDIREYYSTEQTYADPSWIIIYGDGSPMPKPILAMDGNMQVPASYALKAYPNPFNPTTNIRFDLIDDAAVTISIFNIRGQHVATIVDCDLDKGSYVFPWSAANTNGTQLPTGVYIARMQVKAKENNKVSVLSQRLMYMK